MLKRLKENYSSFIVIVGKPRTGKSSVALRISYDIHKKILEKEKYKFESEIDFESYVIAKVLKNTVNNFKDWAKRLKNMGEDDIILFWDEFGREAYYAKWSDEVNYFINAILQTQAFRKKIFLFTVPDISLIVKKHAILLDFVVSVVGRGYIRVYKYFKDPSDASNTKIYRKKIEEIANFPKPPKILYSLFSKSKEIPLKENIMKEILKFIENEEKVKDIEDII